MTGCEWPCWPDWQVVNSPVNLTASLWLTPWAWLTGSKSSIATCALTDRAESMKLYVDSLEKYSRTFSEPAGATDTESVPLRNGASEHLNVLIEKNKELLGIPGFFGNARNYYERFRKTRYSSELEGSYSLRNARASLSRRTCGGGSTARCENQWISMFWLFEQSQRNSTRVSNDFHLTKTTC